MNETDEVLRRAVVESLIIDPSAAITIDDALLQGSPRMSEKQWLSANRKLLDEIGAERYLQRLLEVLKGKDAASRLRP